MKVERIYKPTVIGGLVAATMFTHLVPLRQMTFASQNSEDYIVKSNVIKDFQQQEFDYVEGKTFTDVSSNKWYASAVKEAYEYGLITGKGNNQYDPQGSITIAEVMTIAATIHSLGYKGDKYLGPDCTPWYTNAVYYCYNKHITEYDAFQDEFTRPATRAEVAYIFAGIFPEDYLKPINNVTSLPDVKASDKYASQIFTLYNAGVLSGSDSKGTFNPNSTITRAEIASIILRIVEPESRVGYTPTETPNSSENKVEFNIPSDYREQIEKYMNAVRKPIQMEEILLNDELCEIAAIRAKELSVYYSSTRPDGTSYKTAFEDIDASIMLEVTGKGMKTINDIYITLCGHTDADAMTRNPELTDFGIAYYIDGDEIYWCATFTNESASFEDDTEQSTDNSNTSKPDSNESNTSNSNQSNAGSDHNQSNQSNNTNSNQSNTSNNTNSNQSNNNNKTNNNTPEETPNSTITDEYGNVYENTYGDGETYWVYCTEDTDLSTITTTDGYTLAELVSPGVTAKDIAFVPNSGKSETVEIVAPDGAKTAYFTMKEVGTETTNPDPEEYANWFFEFYRNRAEVGLVSGLYDKRPANYPDCAAAIINHLRDEYGVPHVEAHPALNEVASIRAKELAISFSHTRPNGESWSVLYRQCGYKKPDEPIKGEGEDIAGTTSLVNAMSLWIDSPGHLRPMLQLDTTEYFTHIGIGYDEEGGMCLNFGTE